MRNELFQSTVADLYEFFNYNRKPSPRSLSLVFNRVKHIPDKAVPWIQEQMESDYDTIPRNLGKAFHYWWVKWQERHPEAKEVFKPVPCDECHGKGLIWFSKHNDEAGCRFQYCGRCAKCENWKQHLSAHHRGKYVTKDQLLKDGYTLEIGTLEPGEQVHFSHSVGDMIKSVASTMSMDDIPF